MWHDIIIYHNIQGKMASKITFKSWTCKVSIVFFFLNIKKLAAVDCGLLTNPVNKTQLYTPKDTIIGWRAGLGSVCYLNGSTSEGSIVQFTCAEGHYVYGNKYAKCRNDGKWGIDGRGLKCEPIVCVRPHFDIENGKVHTFLDNYGQYILYSIYWVTCDFGYKPNGDAIRVCLVNDTKHLDGTNSDYPLNKGIWTQEDKQGKMLPGYDTIPTCTKDENITFCNKTGLIDLNKCRSLINDNTKTTVKVSQSIAMETSTNRNEMLDSPKSTDSAETGCKCYVQLVFLFIFGVCYAIGFFGTIRLACLNSSPCNKQRFKDWIFYGIVRPLGHFLLPWIFYQQERENNNESLREDFKNLTRLNNENKDLKTEMEKHCQKIRNIQKLLKFNPQLRTDENWNSKEKVNILMEIMKIDGAVTKIKNTSPGYSALVERREEEQLLLPDNDNDIQSVLNQLRVENSQMRRDNEHNETTLDEIKSYLREINPMSLQIEPASSGSFLYFIGQLKGIMDEYTNPLLRLERQTSQSEPSLVCGPSMQDEQTRGDLENAPSTSSYYQLAAMPAEESGEEKKSHTTMTTLSKTDNQTNSKEVDLKAEFLEDKSPITSKDKSPSTSEDKSPSTSKDKSPSTSEDKSPITSKGKSPSTSKDKSPSTSKDKSPITSKDKSPITSEDKSPSTSKDKSPSTK